MKLITISVPAYNEQESITTLYETIVNVMDSIKDKYTFLNYYLSMMVVRIRHWK